MKKIRLFPHRLTLLLSMTVSMNFHTFAVEPDTVKAFLENTPCVALVEFEVQDGATKKPLHQYQARVCGSDFVLFDQIFGGHIDVPISETNRNRAPLLVGRQSQTRWSISGYEISRSIVPHEEKPDSVTVYTETSYAILCELLTFGAQTIHPGSFKWNGNSFSATPNNLGKQFAAGKPEAGLKLFQGNIKQVDALTFSIMSPTHGMTYVRYDPTRNLPQGWPAEILRGCTPDYECNTIIKIKKVDTNLSSISNPFDPYSYISAKIATEGVVSNGVQVVQPRITPQQVTLVTRDLKGTTPRKSYLKVLVFSSIIIIMAAITIWNLRKQKA